MKVNQSLDRGLLRKKPQKQKIPTKSGVTGTAYPHSMGGMAPGGGGGTPPPSAKEALQMIKGMMNQKKKMRRMILMRKLNQ